MSQPVPAGAGSRRLSRAAVLLIAVAVLAVVLAAAAAAATVRFGSGSRTTTSTEDRAAIISAAVSGVTATASYDWKTLAADEQKTETQLAPPLKAAYADRIRTQVAPLADKYHVKSTASVDPKFGAGIVKISGDHAQVLLYVDQIVSNTQLAHPRLDQTRVLADLVDQGGRWLLSGLRTL